MQVTLTDQQWSGVKVAAAWFKTATQHFTPDYAHFHSPRGRHISAPVSQSFTFAGYAGSGKSTCVGQMIETLGLTEDQVLYMAPTGKAAKVLSKKLHADGWQNGAKTIHSTIYMPRSAKADQIKKELERVEEALSHRDGDPKASDLFSIMSTHDLEVKAVELEDALRAAMSNEGPSFSLKEPTEIPEGVKLFVVDEASMVDTETKEDLERYGIPVLAIGDPGQLPPVGGVCGFDMEDPDVFLTEIHRQAAENPIIYLATLARKGEILKPGDYGDGVVVLPRSKDNVTLDMSRDAMVLCGTHRKRWSLTGDIRTASGFTSSGPMEGEPILVCKNSRKHPGLVNGSLLINNTDHGDLKSGITRLKLNLTDPEADGLKYDLWGAQCFFEEHTFRKKDSFSGKPKEVYSAKVQCEQLDWGHVLTVHKSQGSEWDDVVVHDESGVFRDQGSRWLYTAITRSSNKLSVIV